MKKIRKLSLIYTLVVSMFLTTISVSAYADLSDANNHWAAETISKFLEKKYINGYKDGTFKPDNQVTRAEFVRMVNKVMGFTKEGDISKYTDVPSNAWYYKDIKIAVGENYLKGTSESTISPEDKITREQAITIVARIYNLSGETDLTKYSDYKDISEYAVKPMQAMIKLGLVKGYEDGTLLPKKNLSRAEAVVLLDRITEKLGKLDPADDEKKPEIGNENKPAVDDENKQPEKPRPIKPRPNRPKKVNKTALIKAIDAGKAIQNDALYTNADQALKDALLKAIENGEKVRDSIKASQKEVNEATKAINDAIDKLNGNKTTIAESYTPTGLDPKVLVNDTNALTDEEKNEVINALKEANTDLPQGTTITVDNTGKATFTYSDKSTDEVSPEKLIEKKSIDKELLKKAIVDGTDIQKDTKFKNADQGLKDALLKAIEKGKAIDSSNDASQKEVDDATKAINDAINKLNGKPNPIADGYEPTGLDPKVLVNDTNALTNEEKNEVINALKEANTDLPQGTTITVDNTGKATFTYSDKSTDEILPEKLIEQKADIVREENTKIVDLYWSQYVSIDFIEPPTDNKNIAKSYKVEIDGVDITEDLRPVSDDSRLVKWEITSLNPKELIATRLSDGKTETVKLSDNQNPTPPVLKGNMSVKYFLSKGPISYFEYHQSNYDEKGNLRIKPRKTTFGHEKEDASIPKHYVKKAEMNTDGNGEIIVLFESEVQEHKDWIANIKAPIKLLSSDGTNRVIVDSVPFTVEENVANGNYTVGKLSITTGGPNFRSTGEYILQIKSNEKTKYVPVHIVRDVAPTMTLKAITSINSGDNIWFDVKGMLIRPGKQINRVILTDPTGAVKQIPADQYSFFGNSFVLYNDVKDEQGQSINNIPYNGKYTIKVEPVGYKDMEATFDVEGGTAPPTSGANTLDAVSRATGGGSSGGSSGGSGSLMTQGTILFNGDLLINALIIQKLELEYPHAKEIAERFDRKISGLEATNVMDNAKDPKYDIYDFSKAVQDAKVAGKYLSFEEYKETGKIDPNKPYSFKEVLEDNLLGGVRYFGQEEGLESPNFTLVNEAGTEITSVPEKQEVRIKSSDSAFLGKLEAVYINNSSLALDKAKYSVNGDIITINAGAFKIGNNTVVLRAPGYQNGYVPVEVKKDIKEVALVPLKANEDVETTEYQEGEAARICVLGPKKVVADGDPTNGDFLANLKSVRLKKPNGETINLHTASAGGTSQDDFYGVTGSTLTIRPGAFKMPGEYTVIVDAEHYGPKQTSFEIKMALKLIPNESPYISKTSSTIELEFYKDSIGTEVDKGTKKKVDAWKDSFESVSINGKSLNEAGFFGLSKGQYKWSTSGSYGPIKTLKLNKKDLENLPDGNIITIKSDGYKDLTLKVDQEGNIISSEPPTPTPEEKEPNKPVEIDPPGMFSGIKLIWGTSGSGDAAKPYVEEITNVVLNGMELKKVNMIYGESQAFSKSIGTDLHIKISADVKFKAGENTIILKAEGYKDLTLKVDDKGNIISAETPTPTPAGKEPVTNKNTKKLVYSSLDKAYKYVWTTSGIHEGDYQPYVKAITNVLINGKEYTEVGMLWNKDDSYTKDSTTDINLEFSSKTAVIDDENTLVIKATGYKDLTIKFKKDGTITKIDGPKVK